VTLYTDLPKPNDHHRLQFVTAQTFSSAVTRAIRESLEEDNRGGANSRNLRRLIIIIEYKGEAEL